MNKPGWYHRPLADLWILIFYTLLAVVLTWPLVIHFTTHVPGNGVDDPALAWNLWWMKTRLIEQLNLDIFHVDWMFHPIQINLGFYTLTPLNGLLSIPLQNAFGLIPASNILLLSSFVLGAYGTFLLNCYLFFQLTERPLGYLFAAIATGVIAAFASSKLFYAALGQFNIASSHWIPFCMLYALRTCRRDTPHAHRRNISLAALFLIFQAWSELTYATFLIIFLVVIYVWTLLVDRLSSNLHQSDVQKQKGQNPSRQSNAPTSLALSRANTLWLTWRFAMIAFLSLIGMIPFRWAMIPDMIQEGDFFASGGGFADSFSADLLGYLVPTRLHPLFGEWVAGLPHPSDVGQQIYIGYSAMLLAIAGIILLWRNEYPRMRVQAGFWTFNLLLFWLLTLGPEIRWAGNSTGIPGPFALVSRFPFFSGNRYPSRYSVMLMVCVAVLAAFALAWLFRLVAERTRLPPSREAHNGLTPSTRTTQHAIRNTLHSYDDFRVTERLLGVCIVVLGLFVFEHLSIQLPINASVVPPIYERISRLQDNFTLLELPTGWRNGSRVLGRSDKLIMMQQWYQTVHGQPRLGGNTSRNPLYKFQYFVEAPLLGDLIGLMNADLDYIAPYVDETFDEIVARNKLISANVLDFLDAQYLTLHLERSPEALRRFVETALPVTLIDEWEGLNWDRESATIRLYEVRRSESGQTGWQIDLSNQNGALHLGEGWSPFVNETGFRYALRPKAVLLLDLPTAGGLLELRLVGPAQRVGIWLDDQRLTEVTLDRDMIDQRVQLIVPNGMADENIDRLELRFTDLSTQSVPLPVSTIIEPPDERGWPIGTTKSFLPAELSLAIRSAGKDVGDFAHIYLNGVDQASNGLGYNLVALDPEGFVLESAEFDTLVSSVASIAMVDWLQRWPTGTIVAGAIRDSVDIDLDGFRHLSADAIQALQSLGVTNDLRGKHRWSHAFVGVVGAPVGTALESTSLLRPATIVLGPMPDGPRVIGGVGRVVFRPRGE